MVYEHEIDDKVMKINALGGIYGSNVEDYEGCMSIVMDKLMQNRNVKNLVISTTREYEYDFNETNILVNFAIALDDIIRVKKLLTNKPLMDNNCFEFLTNDFNQIKELIMDTAKGDPIGSYVMLMRKSRHIKIRMKSSDAKTRQ